MQGFIVFQYANRYAEARSYIADLQQQGKLKFEWSVVGDPKGNEKGGKRGVEACVDGLLGLYEGKNTGKT